jgi:hypothetical protein
MKSKKLEVSEGVEEVRRLKVRDRGRGSK